MLVIQDFRLAWLMVFLFSASARCHADLFSEEQGSARQVALARFASATFCLHSIDHQGLVGSGLGVGVDFLWNLELAVIRAL